MTLLPKIKPRTSPPGSQPGFSIVELMIGLALGLLIIAGVLSVFVQTNQTRTDLQNNNRQIENGRYAMSVISEDLRMAGFYDSFDPHLQITSQNFPPLSGASALTGVPNPCNTTLSGNESSWINTFFFHVQGFRAGAANVPTCISDVKAGTDILVVRRLSSCIAGPVASPECDTPIVNVPYFQASNCNSTTELGTNTGSTLDYLQFFRFDTVLSNLNRTNSDCTTKANWRRYLVRIYYIANNNTASDGMPTLKRVELGAGSTAGSGSFSAPVSLVDGIESMQLQYGVVDRTTGLLSSYTSDPGTLGGCAGVECAKNWLYVTSVKVSLLSRSEQAAAGYIDKKQYTLANSVLGPFYDRYRRQAYNAVVRLENPSGRITP